MRNAEGMTKSEFETIVAMPFVIRSFPRQSSFGFRHWMTYFLRFGPPFFACLANQGREAKVGADNINQITEEPDPLGRDQDVVALAGEEEIGAKVDRDRARHIGQKDQRD